MFAALAVFYLVQLSPEKNWIFGFIGYSIPFFLIIHFLFLIYWLIRKSWKIIIPVIIFVLGWQHVRSTIQLNSTENETASLKIINYNVRVFNVYPHLNKVHENSSQEMISWLRGQDADIVLLQEYYNDDSSDIYNTREKLSDNEFDYSFILDDKKNRKGAQFGLAIFSKFPIVNKGHIPFAENENQNNKFIFADVLFNKDTVRLINVHLHSMKLRVDDLVKEENEKEQLVKLKETIKRLREGFIEHAKETAVLKSYIQDSKYPVILAGDFNDVPYSYTYLTFRDILQNSFEEAGSGLGFTYNESPSFIRIDNQFSSKSLVVTSHEVHDNVNYSDHFPVSVTYDFKGNTGNVEQKALMDQDN